MDLLFTGANGFLGENLLPLLTDKYNVLTLGLGKNLDYDINLVKEPPVFKQHFDIVLHAAGKAHVIPRTPAEEKSFFDINYKGTINLCKGLEKVGPPKSFVFISTVAVYGLDKGENIDEETPLNGKTPYALSKIKAEEFLQNWAKKQNVKLSILRPSLIAGPNPPGNLGSMIKGIKTGKYLSIGKASARKSILMVQDIANLIPLLENKSGVFNVCDDYDPSFKELETIIAKQLNKKMPIAIPYSIAKILAHIGNLLGSKAPINSIKLSKIVNTLTFSNDRAKTVLEWTPLNVLDNFSIHNN